MTSNKDVIQPSTPSVPKYVPILIILLFGSLLSLLLLRRFVPARVETTAFNFVQATQVFTPGQAMTITSGNVAVYVPRDSVNLPGTISVVSREPNLFPAAAQTDWTRPQVIEVKFLNTQATPVPHIVFVNAVQICFKLTPEQWDDFTKRPDAYQVQYYAVENNPPSWQALPLATYADVNTLCGQTMHFSIFALAIRVDEVIPVTGLTATATSTLSGVHRPPIRTRVPPEATNPSAPDLTASVPTATQPAPTIPPQPTDTQPAPTDIPPLPTDTPAPTEPPPTEPAPTSGLPIPLPTLPIGP